MKVEVMPLTSFEHHGPKKAGHKFSCEEGIAKQLEKAGLVTLNLGSPAKKGESEVEKQSSSPAVQASQKKIATRSKSGAAKSKTV